MYIKMNKIWDIKIINDKKYILWTNLSGLNTM